MKPRFLNGLQATPVGRCEFTGDYVKAIIAPLQYKMKAGPVIEIPFGFETNGVSIPNWPVVGWLLRRVICRPWQAPYSSCAVLHDFLLSRAVTEGEYRYADKVFIESLNAVGCSWWRRRLMYRAVRLHSRGRL